MFGNSAEYPETHEDISTCEAADYDPRSRKERHERQPGGVIEALRTASQQAEAQQPDTGEPVAWIRRHPNGALSNELLTHVQVEQVRRDSGAWVPLYTHPAPSVPDVDFDLQELREIERAMDDFADCGETDVVDTLLLRAVQAGFLECTHFHVANRGALQEAIDAAMLAAKKASA